MGCCSSKPEDIDLPQGESPHVPLATLPQDSSTPPPQNLHISPTLNPQGRPPPDPPSQLHWDPSRIQDPPRPPSQDLPPQPLHDPPSLPMPLLEPVSESDVPATIFSSTAPGSTAIDARPPDAIHPESTDTHPHTNEAPTTSINIFDDSAACNRTTAASRLVDNTSICFTLKQVLLRHLI
ncbi:hypothetical protein F5146DRAFT_1001578 [Armillaria mellea]|nr:hypothetical protein F5146DRAFT_1001578 [Armillaria mellea]